MANQDIHKDTGDPVTGENGSKPLAPKPMIQAAPSPTVLPISILRKEGHKTTTTIHTTTSHHSPVTKVKCILFNLEPILHYIPPRSELTAEEVDNAWFCRLELEAMTAAALDPANERNHNHSGGRRGLERYTTAGSTRLEIHRVQVVAAVLREQERQRKLQPRTPKHRLSSWFSSHQTTPTTTPTNTPFTPLDDQRIAHVAQQLSHECQELAIRQGFNDEIEAHGAIHTDEVDLKSPTILQQMQALHDMRFLEQLQQQAKQKRKLLQQQQRRNQLTNQPTS
jgi:hypothetical protein